MSTVQHLIDKIRITLNDPNQDRWTNATIISLINEAQSKICRKSLILRDSVEIVVHSAQSTYTLPSNLLLSTRILYEGTKLEISSHIKLDSKSSDWEAEVGTPTYALFDGLIRGLVKLSPIPDFIESDPFDITVAPKLELYYIKKPLVVSLVTDNLEIDDQYDDLIDYYVSGKLLRVDADTQNRAFGNEQLQMFVNSLDELVSEVSKDFKNSNTDYTTSYRSINDS